MARIIQFYIPSRHRKTDKWMRPGTRAKLLTFRPRPVKRYPADDWRILGLGRDSAYFEMHDKGRWNFPR